MAKQRLIWSPQWKERKEHSPVQCAGLGNWRKNDVLMNSHHEQKISGFAPNSLSEDKPAPKQRLCLNSVSSFDT